MNEMNEDYFDAKAREVFTKREGDPADAGPLAAWARANVDSDSRCGVIVAKDGRLVAETKHTPGGPSTPGGTYVTSVADGIDGTDIRNREVGLAMGALTRQLRMPVIHVKHWEVCRGAGRFIAR